MGLLVQMLITMMQGHSFACLPMHLMRLRCAFYTIVKATPNRRSHSSHKESWRVCRRISDQSALISCVNGQAFQTDSGALAGYADARAHMTVDCGVSIDPA